MEFLSFLVVVFSLIGVVGIVVFAISLERGDAGMVVISFLGTVFLFLVASHEAFDQGRLTERTLNPAHNYIVKAKKQSDSGMPLVVYDMVDKKDRVIDLETYPPSGFSEVVTADGKILLVPK